MALSLRLTKAYLGRRCDRWRYLASCRRSAGPRRSLRVVRRRCSPNGRVANYRPIGRSASNENPRACGADAHIGWWVDRADGAPPRMRGGHEQAVRAVAPERSTPARAGRTACERNARSAVPEHLRVYGANRNIPIESLTMIGTPPHAGRTSTSPAPARPAHKSTSACAERTSSALCAFRKASGHLRRCGEDTSFANFRSAFLPDGPACARACRFDTLDTRMRNTPACTGRTSSAMTTNAATVGHLRVCGADWPWTPVKSPGRGTPHVCGRVNLAYLVHMAGPRSTPASAERTSHKPSCPVASAVPTPTA
jgi:hypothetical protein